MEMVLDKLVHDPMRIGFVSFTRAARREAAERAAAKFNIPIQSLEKSGWFRTLHSVAYKCLAIQPGELLAGSDEDTEWLRGVLGDGKVKVAGAQDDDAFAMPSDAGESSKALQLWDAARNRQVPLGAIWDGAYDTDSRLPALALCKSVVTVYEDAKKEGGRYDFCDLLMRYAGKRWSNNHDAPFDDVEPEGFDPGLPVFIHDESQDSSLLTWLVFKRLTRFSSWVYLMGDSWQSIYEFAGADGRLFSECAVAKEEILPISYRCPSNILAAADEIMSRGGHKPRPFRSEKSGGEVCRIGWRDALTSVRADEKTLVLARTNDYARQCAAVLDDLGIPWIPTKGNGGFNAPKRAAGIAAIVALQKGQSLDGHAIHCMMELLPVSADGTRLFEHGAKAYYQDKDNWPNTPLRPPVELSTIADCGGTHALREIIASGKYVEVLEAAPAKMAKAAQVHGIDAVVNPKVRIGTCHSAKGAQAAHVVAVNRIPYPTMQAIQEESGMEAERRVWYVTASRASSKLTIAESDGEPFPEL